MIPKNIKQEIEQALSCKITSEQSISGGCIASAAEIKTQQGSLFIKYNAHMDFHMEANGLNELAKSNSIKIPNVILVSDDFLVLEFIRSSTPQSGFFTNFGKQFAKMHLHTGESFGFFENNYIGNTPQLNQPTHKNWPQFYFQNRLLYQLEMAKDKGLSTRELENAILKIERNIEQILAGTEEAPCLLHGDLWSGNFLVGPNNTPVLIDPAVYYGHREADLAMTELFGGFPEEFYRAYQKEYPLTMGYQRRVGLYKLYHMLNHLNLFGRSYYSSALTLALQYSD